MRRLLILSIATVLTIAGCAPGEPIRFFALTPLETPAVVADSEVSIGVLPIALAAYLDRSGIVLRTQPNELAVSSLHNWIEPLDTQVRRVVARNLAQLLGTDRVFLLPEQRLLPMDYTVEIAIERFEIVGAPMAPDAASPALATRPESAVLEAVLEARWTLFAGDDRRVLQTAFERLSVGVEPPADFAQRVAALSDALGRLTRAVATEMAARRS